MGGGAREGELGSEESVYQNDESPNQEWSRENRKGLPLPLFSFLQLTSSRRGVERSPCG